MNISVFSGWFDEVVAWAAVLAVIFLAKRLLPRMDTLGETESLCVTCSWGLLGLAAGIALVLLFGWIFLIILKIESPLWLLWQPSYMLARMILNRPLPICVFILTVWALLGKWAWGYGMRTISLAFICLGVLGSDLMVLWMYPTE